MTTNVIYEERIEVTENIFDCAIIYDFNCAIVDDFDCTIVDDFDCQKE